MNRLNNFNIVPIGPNCYYNALSASLDFWGHIDIMLLHTGYDFLYKDIKSFIHLNITGDIEDYLLKRNPLIFAIRPDTFFENTICQARELNVEVNTGYLVVPLETKSFASAKSICKEYCEKGFPIIVAIDVSALKDDYGSIGATIPGTASRHLINILDIRDDKCWIVDSQLRANGYINLDSVIRAASSFGYNFRMLNLEDGVPSTKELLKNHIIRNLNIKTIGGYEYDSINAMDRFIGDFNEILQILEHMYGMYAHSVLSYILWPQRLERRGCGVLYHKIADKVNNSLWSEITKAAEESGALWYQIDAIMDKNFLKDRPILNISKKIVNILERIYELDKTIYSKMELMLQDL